MDVPQFNKDEQANWAGGSLNKSGGSQFWFGESKKKLGGD